MKQNKIEKPYELHVNDEIYCFQYPNPDTRDGGKTYSGVARYWKKGTGDEKTYPFYIKGEDISQVFFIVREGVRELVTK